MARTPYQPIGLYALSYNDAVGLTKEFDDLRAALRKSEAEVARLDALNRELAVDLKEWRIRFPANDPGIARRMVEDRTRAESAAALATDRAARESAEQLAVWVYEHSAELSTTISNGMVLYDGSLSHDGTDAGILAALRRAMEGEK